jgi:hypothetical protein
LIGVLLAHANNVFGKFKEKKKAEDINSILFLKGGA